MLLVTEEKKTDKQAATGDCCSKDRTEHLKGRNTAFGAPHGFMEHPSIIQNCYIFFIFVSLSNSF